MSCDGSTQIMQDSLTLLAQQSASRAETNRSMARSCHSAFAAESLRPVHLTAMHAGEQHQVKRKQEKKTWIVHPNHCKNEWLTARTYFTAQHAAPSTQTNNLILRAIVSRYCSIHSAGEGRDVRKAIACIASANGASPAGGTSGHARRSEPGRSMQWCRRQPETGASAALALQDSNGSPVHGTVQSFSALNLDSHTIPQSSSLHPLHPCILCISNTSMPAPQPGHGCITPSPSACMHACMQGTLPQLPASACAPLLRLHSSVAFRNGATSCTDPPRSVDQPATSLQQPALVTTALTGFDQR
jgi:hypothetical protein